MIKIVLDRMPVLLRNNFRIECADKKGFVIFNSKGCCVKNSKKTDEKAAGSALAKETFVKYFIWPFAQPLATNHAVSSKSAF